MVPSRRARVLALAALAVVLAASWVEACPVCATETGEQVRRGIFGPDLARNLLVTLLPFLVVLVAIRIVPGLLLRPGPRPALSIKKEVQP